MATPLFDHGALVERRYLAGLSRPMLAERAHLSLEALRLIELGRTVPRPQTVKALADALAIKVTDLWISEAAA